MGSLIRIAVLCLPGVAAAQPASDDTFAVERDRGFDVAGGLLVASPAVLPGSMSTGLGVDVVRHCGCTLEYGAQLGWSRASGTSTAWSVTHDDLRLRAIGGVRRTAGRGAFSLRLGLGTTVVHEMRERNQGDRAGLMGEDLRTSAWRAIPAGDLEGVVSLHIAGRWIAVVGGGPSLYLVDGDVRAGWTTQLGAAWQP